MTDRPDTGRPAPLGGVPDLPLIIEQLQNQLDDLRAAVEAQQSQLNQQAARLAELERR
jgi:hypothetical protein